MKKVLLVLCALVLLVGTVAEGAEPIKIGCLVQLTGSGATWGEHHRDMSIIAVEEINAAGGLLGRPVELVIYDFRGRQEDAVNAARRLILEDKVQVIAGTNFSGCQIAIVPISEQHKVPIVSFSATNPAVTVDPQTGKVRPYSFRVCFTDPYQGKAIAEFLGTTLNLKTAVIFHDVGSDYSEGMKQFFEDHFPKVGGKVVGTYGYRDGDVDFRAQITQAKATGAEAVFLPGMYKEMALIIKQAAEMDWKPVFIGGDGYSPAMTEIAGDAMNGTYWLTHIATDDPDVQPLVKKYEKRFNKKPVEIVSCTLAYDTIMWIADAIKRAGEYDGAKIRDALANTQGLQLPDFVLTVDPATNTPHNKPTAILVFEGSVEKLYQKVIPQD
ncbi:ABC transporter substrate-binding protein [Aminiphilus circumscriptus]|jgi:branched-chain amino acid transport system substrate-binding protein|uniref:ABC transporter substrate-binding protein n=1 Tax=Aminiphilus circumscriptus TaxID=290732 RepID=UPI0004785531|nr:ABC transporter substrate-binding protein [Aminiphilus circumscriptus]